MDSGKSINSLEMKNKNRLPDYLLNFLKIFVNNFSELLLYMDDCFFRFLLHREVLRFWLNQTFGWECTGHTSLTL